MQGKSPRPLTPVSRPKADDVLLQIPPLEDLPILVHPRTRIPHPSLKIGGRHKPYQSRPLQDKAHYQRATRDTGASWINEPLDGKDAGDGQPDAPARVVCGEGEPWLLSQLL